MKRQINLGTSIIIIATFSVLSFIGGTYCMHQHLLTGEESGVAAYEAAIQKLSKEKNYDLTKDYFTGNGYNYHMFNYAASIGMGASSRSLPELYAEEGEDAANYFFTIMKLNYDGKQEDDKLFKEVSHDNDSLVTKTNALISENGYLNQYISMQRMESIGSMQQSLQTLNAAQKQLSEMKNDYEAINEKHLFLQNSITELVNSDSVCEDNLQLCMGIVKVLQSDKLKE